MSGGVLLIEDFEIREVEVDPSLKIVTVLGHSKQTAISYTETFDADLARFLAVLAAIATLEEVVTWSAQGTTPEAFETALEGRVAGLVRSAPLNDAPGRTTFKWVQKWDSKALKRAFNRRPKP
mgnify:CR=1 FL=1